MTQIIEYDPNHGHAIGDGDVEMVIGDIIKDLANGYNNDIAYANESVFHAIQLAILEGRIACQDIQFRYKRQVMELDMWGRPNGWPDGFCDQHWKSQESILKAMMAKSNG